MSALFFDFERGEVQKQAEYLASFMFAVCVREGGVARESLE